MPGKPTGLGLDPLAFRSVVGSGGRSLIRRQRDIERGSWRMYPTYDQLGPRWASGRSMRHICRKLEGLPLAIMPWRLAIYAHRYVSFEYVTGLRSGRFLVGLGRVRWKGSEAHTEFAVGACDGHALQDNGRLGGGGAGKACAANGN